MWQEYFKFIKLVPGRVVVFGHGTIDFSDPGLSVELIKMLYEKDFPYLKITEKGKEKLYGIKPKKTRQRRSTASTSNKKEPAKN